MDEFTYTNIFDTKGVEYIVVIAFLLLIIPFWRLLNKPLKAKVKAMEAVGYISENLLRIPQGIFYCKNHSWTHLEKSGSAKVGLDDLLMHITGSVKVSTSITPGDRVKKGDLIATMHQNEKQLKLSSPISGEFQIFNKFLIENPEIINKDPYDKGWIVKIKPEKWTEETKSYVLAEDAVEWAKKELVRIKDFISVSTKKISPESSMVVLQEGGELTDNPLSIMPNEIWEDFQKEFLD